MIVALNAGWLMQTETISIRPEHKHVDLLHGGLDSRSNFNLNLRKFGHASDYGPKLEQWDEVRIDWGK